MNESLRVSFYHADHYDVGREYDYRPIKEEIKECWSREDSLAQIVDILDIMAEVGEIDDPELAAMMAASYSDGVGDHDCDNRLAQLWSYVARGEFDAADELVDKTAGSYASIMESVKVYGTLSVAGDPRAIQSYVFFCCLLAGVLNNMYKDTGGAPINRAEYYATQGIAWSRNLQSPEFIASYPAEAIDYFFGEENLAMYRKAEADCWFERGRTFRFKYLASDDNYAFRGACITSMKNSADLGNELAKYYFPSFLMRRGTDEQLDEAADYAKQSVLANPELYIRTGDSAGERTNDVEVGQEVVCLVAQYFAQGLGSFPKDGNQVRELFIVASNFGNAWAKEALEHFKKHLLGGWEYFE